MPSQSGKVCVVTGANSGLGFEVALALAISGANVVLAVRNEKKAKRAIEEIKNEFPDALVTFIQLDLSSLESIRDFTEGS